MNKLVKQTDRLDDGIELRQRLITTIWTWGYRLKAALKVGVWHGSIGSAELRRIIAPFSSQRFFFISHIGKLL